MLVLGVDVGFRHFGYCLVQVNGTPEVVARDTINLGATTQWRDLIAKGLALLPKANLVSIEELVWYGKRRGVLGLAHLAGAVAGWAIANSAEIMFFQPMDVKAATRAGRFPKAFTEHEKDSLSLCRLALTRRAESKGPVGEEKLAHEAPTPAPAKRARKSAGS